MQVTSTKTKNLTNDAAPERSIRDRILDAAVQSLIERGAARTTTLEVQRKAEAMALDPAEARAWLAGQGHAEPALSQALEAARGHPGLAAEWLAGGGLALRDAVRGALERLATGRASPLETAQAWLADDQAALRLRFAAELALDGLAARLGGRAAPALTLPADVQKLSAWFDGINRARDQLPVPALRHDLALAGLLLEWRNLVGSQGKGAGR